MAASLGGLSVKSLYKYWPFDFIERLTAKSGGHMLARSHHTQPSVKSDGQLLASWHRASCHKDVRRAHAGQLPSHTRLPVKSDGQSSFSFSVFWLPLSIRWRNDSG
ncbi:hypothetical protein BREU_0844 [Bifidobacterium reuteri DSM 23975]|uniref:Uncharacterized protein n=1 Tax=Bifidobacterium reuteri DSM 23975 TaxID=1437610 RepID=A0A087CXQ7_9BIFI|nr:hypothetical protein BREU_0844 [Bifidobacterium reuteri DSM 23975]